MSQWQELQPTDIIVFGGTGDLSKRKILPAFYHRLREGQLPDSSRIIILGRAQKTEAEHQHFLREACETFIPEHELNEKDYAFLAQRVFYHSLDAKKIEDFKSLAAILDKDARPQRMFYLATPADIYGDICEKLHDAGVTTAESRVVLEKPIGYGLDSFRAINESVLRFFTEQQIYRIDHYLGKETVQNLMVLRFTNNVFHRLWNGDVVDHVQITVAESTGLENRHAYYDEAGALRDMVQNHLLQLLCLIAMEPPNDVTPDAIRDEKLKVLRALRPFSTATAGLDSVRGQYKAGSIGGKHIDDYTHEMGIADSDTETFVAFKAHVDNWRWAGVPFYVRTGKSMTKRYSEIVVQFKEVPHHIFADRPDDVCNRLVIRLQPDEYIQFQMMTKIPGPGGYRFKPVKLNLSLTEEFEERYPDAYERLLMDVVRGNQTLFMRSDEVEAAWLWIETLLDGWKNGAQKVIPYPAGSEGPEHAALLLARDGRAWHKISKGIK